MFPHSPIFDNKFSLIFAILQGRLHGTPFFTHEMRKKMQKSRFSSTISPKRRILPLLPLNTTNLTIHSLKADLQ
jgi:hypothetical protein